MPKRFILPTLLFVGMCILAWHGSVSAQDKVITFTKDIDVVPSNPNPAKRINIRLGVDKTQVQPGDTVSVSFETDRDSYLTLLDLGTSGKITRLWPNQFSGPDNFVKARKRYSFPASQDKFQFKVSGPHGIERIVALATLEKDRIIREEEFSEYKQGFKSLPGQIKDLVVEAARRTDRLRGDWGSAAVRLSVGAVPSGGRITSRNVYLLSVGAPTGKLQYCSDDARSFRDIIVAKLQIPESNIRLLVGPQATKAAFMTGLKWLAGVTQPEDLVLVYFSGHGTQIKDLDGDEADGLDEVFICYHDRQELRPSDPDLKDILLVDDELADLMKTVPARRRLVVVDSCHSGTISKMLPDNLVSKYYPLLTDAQIKELQIVPAQGAQPGRHLEMTAAKETLLAACADPETSYEDRSKRSGLFTYWLLEHIKGGGADLHGAFGTARERVLGETQTAPTRQTPQITDEYGLSRDIKF